MQGLRREKHCNGGILSEACNWLEGFRLRAFTCRRVSRRQCVCTQREEGDVVTRYRVWVNLTPTNLGFLDSAEIGELRRYWVLLFQYVKDYRFWRCERRGW
jgi:hypothetical protein